MRQAYDYWQNQPGNYPQPQRRSARRPPRGEAAYKRYRAALQALLPQKAACTRYTAWSARTEARPAARSPPVKDRGAPATDSIAPTEFPRASATTKTVRLVSRQAPWLERPERRRHAARHTVLRADTGRCFPQDLVQTVAEPAIHRPSNGARRRETAGLQFPNQGHGAGRSPLQRMGRTPPRQ